MYHFHNFGQSLKFRGRADSWESRGEGCSNRWKRSHRIQGRVRTNTTEVLQDNIYVPDVDAVGEPTLT